DPTQRGGKIRVGQEQDDVEKRQRGREPDRHEPEARQRLDGESREAERRSAHTVYEDEWPAWGGRPPWERANIFGHATESSMSNTATDRVRSDWNSQARAWFDQREALFAASRPIHEWLVKNLDPHDGQRVLEIAAGPGDTGFLAAKRLGTGRLVSTDLSPEMVDSARKRGGELGIQNAEYRVLDAQAMDLPDASFDGVLCRWGFMLMPDPGAALRECRRVLTHGGRLVFAVFTGPDE